MIKVIEKIQKMIIFEICLKISTAADIYEFVPSLEQLDNSNSNQMYTFNDIQNIEMK